VNSPTDASPSRRDAAVSASIRGQAVWALIAAITLLYFGYKGVVLLEGSFANELLVYTLRIGGIAMVLSTVLLALGVPVALMVDGIFSMLIGAAMVIAGVLWAFENRTLSLDTILELVFGYLFFTAGLRNFRDFARLGEPAAPDSAASPAATDGNTAPAAPTTPAPPAEAYESSAPEADEYSTGAPEGYLSSFAEQDESDTRSG